MLRKIINKLNFEYEKKFLTDEKFIIKKYKKIFGKELNLENPITFNEKLQYRKIKDKNQLYKICADKYKVREYVKSKIDEEILIPLYKAVEKWEEINFGELPNQFVIKTNHDSGTVFIVKDKNKADFTKIKNKINKALSRDYSILGRENFYKGIPRKIIIEKLLLDESGKVPKDYKFHVFNKEDKTKIFVQVDTDRFENHTRAIFDENWKLLPIKYMYELPKYSIEKPENLEGMLKISKKISSDFTYARIDLYEINKKIYFGEITFAAECGFGKFEPEEWDYKFGELFEIKGAKE